MREIKSLSHSSMKAFYEDRDTFFLERLADVKLPREPQGPAAAIGSAFDAYEKSSLALCLFGTDRPDSLEFETLFEAQVEPQNRDLARVDGKFLWECYAHSGQHCDLLMELEASPDEPRFEFEMLSYVEGVPLTTKPDLSYRTREGIQVILDWKCRSFYSNSGASPTKCYRLARWGHCDKASKTETHKLYRPMMFGGMEIHAGTMEEASEIYADQTTFYAWANGVEIGADFISAIDEIVCRRSKSERPNVRVAELRSRVAPDYQFDLRDKLVRCWNAIVNQHIFDDLSLEESQARQRMLDNSAKSLAGEDQYFARLGKKSFY